MSRTPELLPWHSMGVGTRVAGRFVEAWWPGYVRPPITPVVRWFLPAGFGADPATVLGETRPSELGLLIHITTVARFSPHGELKGMAEIGDRWLGAHDRLTIQFATLPDNPP